MPTRKPAETRDDILDSFLGDIERAYRLPNINRYEPLPEQDLFHQSQNKNRILFGGNRGGKTFGGIADDVKILTHRHEHRGHMYPDGPVRMRFIGVDFERGIDQAALPLFAQLIPISFLIDGSWERSYSKSRHILTLKDKSTVSFMSYEQDPDKFQAVSLHHIHFDEEPPFPIFKESRLRLLDTAGTWTLSETPVQQLEWVQDELITPTEDGERTDIDIFYLDTRQNIHLPVDELRDLEKELTPEEAIIRLSGRYPSGSLVFPEFDKKLHVIPAKDFVLTPEHRVYCSMDYGYSNPSAWLWTAVDEEGNITTFRSLYAKKIVVSEWVPLIESVNAEIAAMLGVEGWRPYLYIGDPAITHHSNGVTGTTIQQEYSMLGIPINVGGIVKTRTGNQNVGLNKMHTYLLRRPDRPEKPWWQLTDNNQDLINEVKKARKPKQTLKAQEEKNASEEIRDKDNHAIDAFKYLCMYTHELRPERFTEEDRDNERLHQEMEQFHPRELARGDYAPDTHSSDFVTTIASGQFTTYDPNDFRALEG